MTGGGTGAGAAAHAGGDEDHMGAGKGVEDFRQRLFRASAADIGLGARAQAFGGLRPELDAALALGLGQGLGIGVGDDEFDPFEMGVDHVVDGVAAGAADPQHHDAGPQFLGCGNVQIDRHFISP